MSSQFIAEEVDIYKLPPVNLMHKEAQGTQITIGDLHANPIKLLYLLFLHGIAMDISEKSYEALVEIYRTPVQNLTESHLKRFKEILSKIEFNSELTIRLIGDELADRGNNDYFTLLLLEKLNQHKVPIEILLSNHSVGFIESYEKQGKFSHPQMANPQLLQWRRSPRLEAAQKTRIERYSFTRSMDDLQFLIDQNLVSRDEILAIVDKAYKPTLKAISYSLNEAQDEITIYSHAAIGLNTIQRLAEQLGVNYNNTTATTLAQTIEEINHAFQEHVNANTVHTLYTAENMQKGFERRCNLSHTGFEFTLWNRRYEDSILDRPPTGPSNNYKLHFVHGHDGGDPLATNDGPIWNLDKNNQLGKHESCHKGTYQYLCTPSASAPVKTSVTQPQEYFLTQLELVRTKRNELRRNNHEKAADCANELYKKLSFNAKQFFANEINEQAFKTKCFDDIESARPELEKHRGWKEVLGNLALAIAGLGVGYIIAGSINKLVNGHFAFFKTDSAQKLDSVEEAIKAIAPAA